MLSIWQKEFEFFKCIQSAGKNGFTIYALLLDSPDGQSPCTEMQTPRGQEVLFPLLTLSV